MTNGEYQKIRKRIAYKRRFNPTDWEDIAHDVVVSKLEKPSSKQSIDQAMVDLLRKRFGDPRTSTFDERRSAYRVREFDKEVEAPEKDDSFYLDVERRLGILGPVERAMILLGSIWGLHQREIGMLFDLTEARVNQLLREIERKMKE